MKNQNQMYQKDAQGLLSTTELAQTIGCSESLIRQVRSGERNADKGKGAIIKVADELNIKAKAVAKTCLIEAIEKLVPVKVIVFVAFSLLAACKKDSIEPIKRPVSAPDRIIEKPELINR